MKLGAGALTLLMIGIVGLGTQGCNYAWVRKDKVTLLEDEVAQLKSEKEQLQDELQSQIERNLALKEERDQASEEKGELLAQLKQRDETIEAQRDMLNTFQETVTELRAARGEAQSQLDNLRKQLAQLEGTVSVSKHPYGTAVKLPSDLAFAPGSAELKEDVKQALEVIADKLKNIEGEIQIAGHTDSQPIRHSPWNSNLELSGARALAVLSYLADKGVAHERMHFVGYGAHKLAMKGGQEDQAASRRVEIIIISPGRDLDAIKLPDAGKVPPAKEVTPVGPPTK